jgi:hypothetical protein
MQKFNPKIRIRSAGATSRAGPSASASNAAAEDRFKELIKQAQSDKAWERVTGRSRETIKAADLPQPLQAVLLIDWHMQISVGGCHEIFLPDNCAFIRGRGMRTRLRVSGR